VKLQARILIAQANNRIEIRRAIRGVVFEEQPKPTRNRKPKLTYKFVYGPAIQQRVGLWMV
jgi:hypothetical protein